MSVTPRLQQTSLVHPVGLSIGAYIAKWNDRQTVMTSQGEQEVYFTSDTDFGQGYYEGGVPIMWYSGLDPEQGARPIGHAHTIRGDQFGLYAIGYLFVPRGTTSHIIDQVHALVMEKAVRFSFGTINIRPAGGIYSDDGRVLYAPIAFVSITPISERMEELRERTDEEDTAEAEIQVETEPEEKDQDDALTS